MLSYPALLTLALLALTRAADPETPKTTSNSATFRSSSGFSDSSFPSGPAKQVILPAGPPFQYPQYGVNLLEPQFQYPGFNYVPDKQGFPRVQPPVVFYAGAAPPGQQFLYRPGAPPGNFLVPQPQPDPGVLFNGANPQGPVFVAGYPKPAHIPPIEKDAEEVPSLAGNHPVTAGAGRPLKPAAPIPPASKPEKLETFDEPVSAGEADVLAEADKNPNDFFPKKPLPNAPPALKPGHQFFILNGNPLYSNYPFQGVNPPQPNYQPGVPPQSPYQPGVPPQSHYQPGIPPQSHYQPGIPPQQLNPNVYLYRQPQYVPELQPHQFNQVPIQDLFLRNSVTGQISDVKPLQLAPSGLDVSLHLEPGNFISLNNLEDFRSGFYLRNPAAIAATPQTTPQKVGNVAKEYELSTPILLKAYTPTKNPPTNIPETELRLGKQLDLSGSIATLDRGVFLPTPTALGDYYRYSQFKDAKVDDDSVIIDAKTQNDDKESEAVNAAETKREEPSLSQAQPSAIALAGKGGVASAAPKGTALAGVKGLAVAKPQATAVAGPSREEAEKKTKSKKERQ